MNEAMPAQAEDKAMRVEVGEEDGKAGAEDRSSPQGAVQQLC